MRKVTMYLGGAAVVGIAALASTQPAKALPIADGSFTIQAKPGTGTVTVNTGNITLDTATKTEPGLEVQWVTGNLAPTISPGATATLSNPTVPIPIGVGNPVSVNFSLSVNGVVFQFFSGTTNSRIALDTNPLSPTAGSFATQYSGLLIDGNGIFESGTPVSLSESCSQSAVSGNAGLISCGNSVTVSALVTPPGGVSVPEPGSLALLGASLAGFSLLRRRHISG